MESKFKAKLSLTSLIITILANAILIIALVSLLKDGFDMYRYLIGFFILLTLLTVYLLHPVEYIIDKEGIKVKKPLNTKIIDAGSIMGIAEIEYKNLVFRGIRLFGSGGVWGFFGIFRYSKYGTINMQVTDLNNMIIIKIKDKMSVIISPNNKKEFIEKFALMHSKSGILHNIKNQ